VAKWHADGHAREKKNDEVSCRGASGSAMLMGMLVMGEWESSGGACRGACS
jgi:hypothetical protein